MIGAKRRLAFGGPGAKPRLSGRQPARASFSSRFPLPRSGFQTRAQLNRLSSHSETKLRKPEFENLIMHSIHHISVTRAPHKLGEMFLRDVTSLRAPSQVKAPSSEALT